MRAATAATISAVPLILPALVSIGANPSPAHPEIVVWYRTLDQPWFKSPDALVPVAWTVIEAALATGAYRVLRAPPSLARTGSRVLLAWNVGMIGAWSRLFFRHRVLGPSTVAAATMVATGIAYSVAARKVDRTASHAGLPFIGWVAFATVLTAGIWGLNRRP